MLCRRPSVRVRKGWDEQQVAERVHTTRRDLRNASSCGRIHCYSTCRTCSNSTDGVQSEHDALYFSFLGELEKQCIEFCHEAEIAGLDEALSIVSGGESLFHQMSSKKLLHRHPSALDPPSYPSMDGSEASPELSRAASGSKDDRVMSVAILGSSYVVAS